MNRKYLLSTLRHFNNIWVGGEFRCERRRSEGERLTTFAERRDFVAVDVIQLKMLFLTPLRLPSVVSCTMAPPDAHLELNYFSSIFLELWLRFEALGSRDLSTVERCQLGKSDDGELPITRIICNGFVLANSWGESMGLTCTWVACEEELLQMNVFT